MPEVLPPMSSPNPAKFPKSCRAITRRDDCGTGKSAPPERQRAPLVLTLRAADGAPSPASPHILKKGREGILFSRLLETSLACRRCSEGIERSRVPPQPSRGRIHTRRVGAARPMDPAWF